MYSNSLLNILRNKKKHVFRGFKRQFKITIFYLQIWWNLSVKHFHKQLDSFGAHQQVYFVSKTPSIGQNMAKNITHWGYCAIQITNGCAATTCHEAWYITIFVINIHISCHFVIPWKSMNAIWYTLGALAHYVPFWFFLIKNHFI